MITFIWFSPIIWLVLKLLYKVETNLCNKCKNFYFALMNSFVVYMSNQISSVAVIAVHVSSFELLGHRLHPIQHIPNFQTQYLDIGISRGISALKKLARQD